MAGWIKLHRKILENPVFQKPELFQLFSYCLLRANHSETKIIWNGQEEILEIGCFITGRKSIAGDTGQNESAIYRNLKVLKKLNMISVKSNNKYSVVKVLNYGVYQGSETESEQPVNNQRTTSEQPVNTDKNVKNNKNDKNVKKDIYTPDELEVLSCWNAEEIIKHTESEPLKKEIAKALKSQSKEKVILAITQYSTLLHDTQFYYSNRFTLTNFLKQKNGLPNFLSDGQIWTNYIERGKRSGFSKKYTGAIASGEAETDEEWPISNSFTRRV